MARVLLLVFIGPTIRGIKHQELRSNMVEIWKLPVWDWLFIVFGISAAYYVGVTWYEIDLELLGYRFQLPEQVLRQGNPAQIDVVFGTILIVVLLEAVRRTLGPIVPIIIIIFIIYAVFGMQMPFQILKHPGVSWDLFINSMYFPEEGIFGVTLWIVSTVVFHFVLFGIIAQQWALGSSSLMSQSLQDDIPVAWPRSVSFHLHFLAQFLDHPSRILCLQVPSRSQT